MEARLRIESSTFKPGKKEKNVIAMASLRAAIIEDDDDEDTSQDPIHLVAVIDVSKSMEDGKLDLVKASLTFVLEHLSERDTLGIVTFGNMALTAFPMTPMHTKGKLLARSKLDGMYPRGATNLSGGLLKGLDLLSKEDISTRSTLMLFTDGIPTRGIIDTPSLQKVVATHQKEKNVQILGFGFGKDHDATMLEAVCSVTKSGTYYYIPDQESIGPQFAECLGGLLSLVVQNVELTIPTVPEYDVMHVWGDHKHRDSSGSYVLEIGDLYRDQQKDILFEILPKRETIEIWCYVSYFNVLTGQQRKMQPILLETTFVETEEEPLIDVEVRKHHHRVLVAAMMQWAFSSPETDLKVKRAEMRTLLAFLKQRFVEGDDLTPLLIEDIKQCLTGMVNYETYWDVGMSDLRTFSSSHTNQRSMSYSTPLQNEMVTGLLSSEAYLNASASLSAQKARSSASLGDSHLPNSA